MDQLWRLERAFKANCGQTNCGPNKWLQAAAVAPSAEARQGEANWPNEQKIQRAPANWAHLNWPASKLIASFAC